MLKQIVFLVNTVAVFGQIPGLPGIPGFPNFPGGSTILPGIPTVPPPGATVPPAAGAGDFVCVPAALCLTGGGGGGGGTPGGTIDVRIVTPTQQASCPAGLIPCFGLTNVPCGVRRGTLGSSADGFSYFGAFPWQAYIVNQTMYTGSGVLLDRYHVLTAAHKVNLNQLTPQNIQVFMGVWNPTRMIAIQNSTVARMIIHPNFNPTTLFNDLAVLRLANPIVLGATANVGTACLPNAQQSFVGQNCMVAGWGQTAFGANDAPTSPQKQVTVPIVNYNTCRTSMANPTVLGTNVDVYLDPNGELCAGGVQSRDACTQDGGAPLVCPTAAGSYAVAGLVIWGKGCGRNGVYGAYVDVGRYRTWIDSAIAALNAG